MIDNAFQFFPRPEAHRMRRDELLPPAQDAVDALLWRIKGSIEKVNAERYKQEGGQVGADIASCFLVYGERGTGKTTVLLCAKYACDHKDEFFGKTSTQATENAKLANDVVWLDVLDLEPLPPKANLLTTVLTRVRGALDRPGVTKDFRDEARSILEEGADSARHDINQLINDATLMWEDIHEPDTRSRASRQVAAASIYAEFRRRFLAAMAKLSAELARQRRSGDPGCPIILPIDNVDRSTDHLRSIVKLAQMVSCPDLWLVMAGDRQDVETFLERAYWKELIQLGKSAGAGAKQDARGEDEALVMARRQAAAALHKLLPPSHRVEVALVSPEDTLSFSPSHRVKIDAVRPELTLSFFPSHLIKVELARPEDVAKPYSDDSQFGESESTASLLGKIFLAIDNGQTGLALIDLFDAGSLFNKALGKQTSERCLTSAGQFALSLPARGVLELWQLTHWIANDPALDKNKNAVLIARIMLRNVISESTMPSWAGRCLLEQMIKSGGKNGKRGTVLDVGKKSDPDKRPWLEGCWQYSEEFYFVLPVNQKLKAAYDIRSWLAVSKGENLRLNLRKEGCCEALPDPVAGWLSVLYDALTWEGIRVNESAVISRMPMQALAQVSATHFGVAIDGKYAVRPVEGEPPLAWQVPDWGNFVAHDLWRLLWQRFIEHIEEGDEKSLSSMASEDGCLASLLCAGWVACALDTFSAITPAEGAPAGGNPCLVSELIARDKPEQIADYVRDAEATVMKAAARCYEEIQRGNSHGTLYLKKRGAWHITAWLIQFLPLLLSHLYVPLPDNRVDERSRGIVDAIKGMKLTPNLAEDWEDNAPFFLAQINAQLADRFPHAEASGANGQKKSPQDIRLETQRWKDGLEPFFNLDRLWSGEHQQGEGSA